MAPTAPPPDPRQLLSDPDAWALFLDFDGTLVELAARPDAIQVPRELPALLRALNDRFKGALAILTGRALGDLDAYLPGSDLAAAGQHGVEWRLNGQRRCSGERSPALSAAHAELERFAAERPGVLVEDKGATIAVHYRGAPDARDALAGLSERLVAAGDGALEWMTGKAVCEIRPAGSDKGRALRDFLAEAPFAGRRALALGDDTTDEAAFAAALAAGGRAIKVGEGASGASWRLESPAAARAWLARIVEE